MDGEFLRGAELAKGNFAASLLKSESANMPKLPDRTYVYAGSIKLVDIVLLEDTQHLLSNLGAERRDTSGTKDDWGS